MARLKGRGFISVVLLVVLMSLAGCVFIPDSDISSLLLIVDDEEVAGGDLITVEPGQELNIKLKVYNGWGREVTDCTVSWDLEHVTVLIGTLEEVNDYEVIFTAVEEIEQAASGVVRVIAESRAMGKTLESNLRIMVKPADQ